MARIIGATAVALLLAGCGGGIGSSALNPFSWFRSGGSETEALVPSGAINRRDPRPLAERVTDLAVERVPGGAIVRARAEVAATGWYGADLALEPSRSGAGALALTFRALPPPSPVRPGGPAARVLVAGTFLSDNDLAGVSQIQVISRTNVATARR